MNKPKSPTEFFLCDKILIASRYFRNNHLCSTYGIHNAYKGLVNT